MALRQIASSAGSMLGSSWRGGRNSPFCTARITSTTSPVERRLAGQQAVERRPQAVDIRPRSQPFELALGLLGAHVSRSAQRAAGERLGTAAGRRRHEQPLARLGPRLDAAHRLGQPPVDDQGLAVLAHDDIGRLDVAVDHAAGVGIIDGVADVHESAEQLAERQVARAGRDRSLTWTSL